MRALLTLCVASLFFAVSTHSLADDEVPVASTDDARAAVAATLTDIDAFLEFIEELYVDLEEGKYGRMRLSDMDLVTTSRSTLRQILTGKSSINELNRDERIAVYNAQEAIAAALRGSVDSRPICRRQHTVGTHRQVTACFTASERREMRESARYIYEGFFRSDLAPPSDG